MMLLGPSNVVLVQLVQSLMAVLTGAIGQKYIKVGGYTPALWDSPLDRRRKRQPW